MKEWERRVIFIMKEWERCSIFLQGAGAPLLFARSAPITEYKGIKSERLLTLSGPISNAFTLRLLPQLSFCRLQHDGQQNTSDYCFALK